MSGPLDSAKVPTASVVGGTYNVTPPAPVDGQSLSLQQDAAGNLLVNVAVGGGGASSNVNISGVNGTPPALTNPLPVELSDGTQAFGTVSNPINIAGSISATNPSVGATGATAPTSATEIGIIVGGNLVGVSGANPVPISGTVSSGNLTNNNAAPGANNQGVLPAIANAANPTWVEGNQVLESVDLSGNQRVKVNAALPAGSNVIGHIIADSGSTTAITGNVTVVQPTGTSLHAVLDATSTTIVTQATGTNLHTVVDSGTITAVTAITNALPAGNNVIGHVITDSGSVTNATLSAETTKVIGTVREADGAGNLLTSNSTTPAGHFSLDSNITSILGTAPTTVGKIDIKGADGDVFVRQATGTNLHVVTDTTSVTNATLSAETTKVIGTVNQGTSPWVVSGTVTSSGTSTVTGAAAADVAASGNPVLVAGVDAAGNVQELPVVDTGAAIGTTVVVTGVSDGANAQILRTPNTFKTVSVSATASGNTAVWAPAAGKKFRLMAFQITGTNIAATNATTITISFQDSVTQVTIGTYEILMPTAVGNTAALFGGVSFNSGWISLGNGYLSSTINNVLNANVSATVTGATGTFRYNVAGTEE